jgi:hypothetical protein
VEIQGTTQPDRRLYSTKELQVEKETKRILQVIVQTIQEQQSRYPVAGLADLIDQITQEVHRPESLAIGPHFFSILEVLRRQLARYPVNGLTESIDRITQELDRPETFTSEHHLLSILEIMRAQQSRSPTTGLADRINRIIRLIREPGSESPSRNET